MAKHLRITIPEPCHENWAAMTPKEQGRHCNSCNKTVVDFSLMTDQQMVEYFKSYHETSCGRFRSEQLNRDIPLNVGQRFFRPFKYIAASLLAIEIFSQKANARDCMDSISQVIVQTDSAQALSFDSCNPLPVDTNPAPLKFNRKKYRKTQKMDVYLIMGNMEGYIPVTMGICSPPLQEGVPPFLPGNKSGLWPTFTFPVFYREWPYVVWRPESKFNNPTELSESENPKKEPQKEKKERTFSFATIVKRLKFNRKKI